MWSLSVQLLTKGSHALLSEKRLDKSDPVKEQEHFQCTLHLKLLRGAYSTLRNAHNAEQVTAAVQVSHMAAIDLEQLQEHKEDSFVFSIRLEATDAHWSWCICPVPSSQRTRSSYSRNMPFFKCWAIILLPCTQRPTLFVISLIILQDGWISATCSHYKNSLGSTVHMMNRFKEQWYLVTSMKLSISVWLTEVARIAKWKKNCSPSHWVPRENYIEEEPDRKRNSRTRWYKMDSCLVGREIGEKGVLQHFKQEPEFCCLRALDAICAWNIDEVRMWKEYMILARMVADSNPTAWAFKT